MSDKLTVMQRTHIAELQNIASRLRAMGVTSISTDLVDGIVEAHYSCDPAGVFWCVPPEPGKIGNVSIREIEDVGSRLVLVQPREEDDA